MNIITGTAILTCGIGASMPPPPTIPPPAPTESDPAVIASRDAERKRRRAAPSNTFLSSFSATPEPTKLKTLLGS